MPTALLEKSLRHGPPPQGLVQVYALSLWKCLDAPYLARGFGLEERTAAFLHTYQWLTANLSATGLKALSADDRLLWNEGDQLITIKMEHVITDEGEVTLHYRRGSDPLAGLSFSLVPGRLVAVGAPTVLLVARMQARRDPPAGAAPRDLLPQARLHAAMLGIARMAGLPVVGVAAANQLSFAPDRSAAMHRAYDGFYATVGGRPLGPGFFWLPTRPDRRPLGQIAIAHRRRARRRRAVGNAITAAAEDGWRTLAGRPAPPGWPDPHPA